MSLSKIISAILLFYISPIRCSVPTAALAAPLPITYRRLAPPSVLPFAASVSTFTRGLNVYTAPYAAGIAPFPYYSRSLIPTNGVLPVSYGAFGSGIIPAAAPGVVAPFGPTPAIATPNGILPSPLLPLPFGVSPGYVPRTISGAFGAPGVVPSAIAPSPLLPAPFGLQGRSVAPAVPISSAVVG